MTSNRVASWRPFRFTAERHLKFVELYSREPCLWDNRPLLQTATNAAHRRLQIGINREAGRNERPMTLLGVKTKIQNLRAVYHQELRKINANPCYTSKISWFAPMHEFLGQNLDASGKNTNVVLPKPVKRLRIKLSRIKPVKIEEEIEQKLELKQSPQVPTTESARSLPSAESSDPRSTTKTASPQSPTATPHTLQGPRFPENISSLQSLGFNEFTFFGLNVGAQLINMPLSNAMIMQSKIQHMLSVERRRIEGNSSDVDMHS
ncbi:uncharacterized protein LOC117568653 [Drosophila albomicans]|uniref:Uncharacterized protein LOC117568653 n=1 Tax=Drosophila albomicans TaxID=7291 RepID=A0A6P8WNS2_DROAB|nr:uncharacterized protein LOC117568653 [Drosophila albomicans]